MICRHCNRTQVNRPRGLCWHCYYAPGVRALYPITSKYARRGIKDAFSPTCEPTAAAVGSPEKVAVLEARAASGQQLWHPHDASGDLR